MFRAERISLIGKLDEGATVSVAAALREAGMNLSISAGMLVGKQQVPPCSDVEVLRIHVHMQSVASINLALQESSTQQTSLQFLQSILSLQYGAYEFERSFRSDCCSLPVSSAD